MTDELDDFIAGPKQPLPNAASYVQPRPKVPTQPQVQSEQVQPSTNPLAKHFRKPGISFVPPSKGYWSPTAYTLNVGGELEVYPMTAADELILKNPDALLSGRALEQIILSCVPQIKTVTDLVSPDLDALFIAIRVASNGPNMDLQTSCPKCKTELELSLNVQDLLFTMDKLTPPYFIELEKDLKAFVRPYTFKNQLDIAIATFEEAKNLRTIPDAENNREAMAKTFDSLTTLKFKLMLDAITYFEMGEGSVYDKSHIAEFLNNSHKKYTKLIEDAILKINNLGVKKSLSVTCLKEECKHVWDADLDFNPTSFFE